MKLKLVTFIALAVLIVIVIFQNTETVTLRFLFWRLSMSQILLLTFTVLSGFVLGVLVAKLPKAGAKRR